MRNQEIAPYPALPTVRTIFLKALHDYIGIVCLLPKPTSGRFEVFGGGTTGGGGVNPSSSSSRTGTFDRLVLKVDPKVLTEAYEVIERHMNDLAVFVDEWLSYQALWDTRVSDVAGKIGDDVDRWHALLVEASDARTALDSFAAVPKEFGPVAVRYDKVQSQINLKNSKPNKSKIATAKLPKMRSTGLAIEKAI